MKESFLAENVPRSRGNEHTTPVHANVHGSQKVTRVEAMAPPCHLCMPKTSSLALFIFSRMNIRLVVHFAALGVIRNRDSLTRYLDC